MRIWEFSSCEIHEVYDGYECCLVYEVRDTLTQWSDGLTFAPVIHTARTYKEAVAWMEES